ncbi:MAG: HAD family hydrolase [Pseudomonadota bacterium]
MDIKAIIFDKDGTLIDFAETYNPATRIVLDQLCGRDDALLQKAANVWGFDLETGKIKDDSVIVAGSGVDLAEAIASLIEIEDNVAFGAKLDEMFGNVCVDTVSALPETQTALKKLQSNGILLGIGTNDSEANAVSQMQRLEFETFFHKILGSDSGYGAKPGPGMVTGFVEHCGLAPEQVMMVGDSLHDLEAGKAAGVVTCGVETGPADRSALEKHADIVLPSIAGLPGYLGMLV